MEKQPIYIIIPVHNRRKITLNCLENLSQNGDLQKYHVIVIDDGSTDGTQEAIHQLYPDVIVLEGDGHLWWTGATKKGMEYAYKKGAEYFIWLNDDTLASHGAIDILVAECINNKQKIVAGQCYSDSDYNVPTYSGSIKKNLTTANIYAAINEKKNCDYIHGNLACLPISIVEVIGYPPADKLPHYQADVVYSWKAKQQGYNLEIIGKATAICQNNPGDPSWLLSDRKISEIWQSLLSPKSPFHFKSYWYFCLSFWGILGILVYIKPYLRLILITILRWLFPKTILQRFKTENKLV